MRSCLSRLSLTSVLLLGLALVSQACVPSGNPVTGTPVPSARLPRPAHVVVVIEENHSYADIIGSTSAPYLNSLAEQGTLFTHSFAITHPSQPNYLALFSGSTQGVISDICPHTFTAGNLASELFAAGFTFAGYSEGLPGVGSTVCTAGTYARKHSPWVNFTDIAASDNRPFSSFPSSASYNQLPTVSFVIPDLDNDMHDGTIQEGDTWLKTNLGAYVTWAKQNKSLLIITWDEDDGSQSNQIPTIFVGQPVIAGRYSETINHYSVLRTLEDMYGLSPLGKSAMTPAIADCWS